MILTYGLNDGSEHRKMYKAGLVFVAAAGLLSAGSLSMTPVSGSVTAEQSTKFSFTYTGSFGGLMLALIDANGASNTCYIAYTAPSKQIYVADDGATVWAYQAALG